MIGDRSPRLYFLSRGDLARIVGLGVAQAAVLVAWVFAVWQAVDAIAAMRGDVALVLPWLGALALLAVANALLRGLEFAVCERIGFDTVRRLRMDIYVHMLGMTPRHLQHRSKGSILLRLTGDLTMLRTWISRGIGRGTIGAIVITGGLAALAWVSVLMAVSVLFVYLLAAALSLTLGRRLRRLTAIVRRRRSLLTSNIDEQIHALAVIQMFGRAPGEYSRLERQNGAMTDALVREARTRGALRGIAAGAAWLGVVVVFAAGLYELAEGYITLGMLVAAAAGVRHLAGPFRALGFAHDYWRRAWISRKKILEFMASRSRPVSHELHQPLRVRRGEIQFDGASVGGALYGITGIVRPGQRVAVTGPTGAGKSTLLNLVGRLVEADEGEVLVDGKPLAETVLATATRHIGMLSPELPLMRGTIRRNVSYRVPSASDEEIWGVLLACGLDEEVAQLPGGLDFWVAEGGRNLSVGQRQRLALARAMMGYPRILLLDEPTANLDEDSKAIFREIMSRYPGTVMAATHDREEAKRMDVVWRLDGGRLVEALPADRLGRRSIESGADRVAADG